MLDELDVRRSAMAYVGERRERSGGVITRAELESFTYAGEQLRRNVHRLLKQGLVPRQVQPARAR